MSALDGLEAMARAKLAFESSGGAWHRALALVEQAKAEREAEDIASRANWHAAWNELYGYVVESVDDQGTFDARTLRDYMRELKDRHVTGPVRAELRRIAGEA